MTTINIPLEIPTDCMWDTDELVARVKEYVHTLVGMVPGKAIKQIDYTTMPGQFSEAEKQRRMKLAYASTGASTIDEVENMLIAL